MITSTTMKKLLFSLFLLLTATVALWAQSPQRMSYQSIIRDGSNVVVASTAVGIKISVVKGTATGTAVYVETHRKTTNANGLVSLEIGEGTALLGTFAGIDWSNGPYLIKTETDPTDGTNYSIPGIAPLNSVPYALYSANGTPGPKGEKGDTGATGATGPTGATGAQGLRGLPGVAGETGPTGARGEDGQIGATGPTGADGLSAYQVWLALGNTGSEANFTTSLTGPQGATGATGPAGATGASGTNGADGLSAYQVWLALGNTGSEANFITSLTGPQGATGATGPAGATGPQGATGAAGASGTNGSAGLSAYQVWLALGNTGSEANFISALTGPQGTTGLQGPTGAAGPAGATGPQGASGRNGANGLSAYQVWLTLGNTGSEANFITSLTGPQGATGATGPQGADGAAASAATFVDLSSNQAIGGTKTFTNPLVGSVTGSSGFTTGNAATVTTNANLTGEVTSIGNATIVTNSAVIDKVLSGYTAGAGTVAATDNIREAIQKLDGNLDLKAPKASPTFTGTVLVPNLGIGTSTPDASAIVEIVSTNQGFLPPRMTSTQKNAITNPAQGLMIYCTNCGVNGEAQLYNGASWVNLVGGAATAGFTCGDNVTFTYNGATVTYGTVIGANSKCWLDRNLGASQVATGITDINSYGDLYQWGRAADGHQSRTSNKTGTNATTTVPNTGNLWDGLFISETSSPFDWLTNQDNNLWQGASGTNNPCPSGYRLPTEAEWETERRSWTSSNSAGAFGSSLKLPRGGYRFPDVGDPAVGKYWSSTVSSTVSRGLRFTDTQANIENQNRVNGLSIRCIKDL